MARDTGRKIHASATRAAFGEVIIAPVAELVSSHRVRGAALLLILGLLAGPTSTHVYWMLGGTLGLHSETATGIRVVAAVVLASLVAAILVVLARVGLWRQALVPNRLIQLFAWALALVFLFETVGAFTWGRADEWWMYGPVSLVIAALAFVVAGSPRPHRPPKEAL